MKPWFDVEWNQMSTGPKSHICDDKHFVDKFFFSQISLTFRFLTNLWIGVYVSVVSVSRLSNNLLQIIIVHILLRRIRDDENLSVLHKRFEQ